jgi:hypothetical protein
MSQKSAPLILAEVVLKAAPGHSQADAQREEAARRLVALGFQVLQSSPISISIAAPAELYERVFGTRVVGQEAVQEFELPDVREDTPLNRRQAEPMS